MSKRQKPTGTITGSTTGKNEKRWTEVQFPHSLQAISYAVTYDDDDYLLHFVRFRHASEGDDCGYFPKNTVMARLVRFSVSASAEGGTGTDAEELFAADLVGAFHECLSDFEQRCLFDGEPCGDNLQKLMDYALHRASENRAGKSCVISDTEHHFRLVRP